ncbi:MAG: type I-B CRISPR-associated protein Cas5b [Thermovenabulum sp.]|uniref:type I-B CRISPR-associated protein Cas5b n=1 Tax=Thermovenabulum sp. TaxID=3100335 RepID=UPI003C7A0263
MSLKVLKIKLYQPFANFRKPFSYGVVDSYPLPPPSTVKGWLHNILGAKNGEYYKMAVSIAGKFDSTVYDIQKIIKFDRVRKESNPSSILREYSSTVISSMIYVTNLIDVELCIHVNSKPEILESILNNIYSSFWGLGRKEDLMRIDFVESIEAKTINYFEYMRQQLPSYGMYLKQETAEKFRVEGIKFRLNYKYEKTSDGLRVFTTKKDVVYVNSLNVLKPILTFDENVLVDDEGILIDLIGDEEYEN